jgi:putative flippase GtrA
VLQADALDEPVDAQLAETGDLLFAPRARLARLIGRVPDWKKVARYGSTSILALAISEVTLLLLFANGVVGATSAALLANLSGTIPSYLLSRYWIWPYADRRRAGRQATLYWIVSIVSMFISSVVTGQISHHTPRERVLHLCILASTYLLISLVLWVAKYIVYERTIFKS